MVLLAGAGLLTRSLDKLQRQDFGYETDHRVTISLTGPLSAYPQPKLDAMYRELQDRLTHIPGVKRAALALFTPLQDNWGELPIRQGHGMPNVNEAVGSSWDHVMPGYLEALGQQIIRGRGITEQDTASTQQRRRGRRNLCAQVLQAGEEPLGAHFGLDLPKYSSTYEIVGIVRNAKYSDAANTETPRPMFFVPLAQRVHYDDAMMQSIDDSTHFIEGAVLQLQGSMDGLEPQVRQVLSEVDPKPDPAATFRRCRSKSIRNSTSNAPWRR